MQIQSGGRRKARGGALLLRIAYELICSRVLVSLSLQEFLSAYLCVCTCAYAQMYKCVCARARTCKAAGGKQMACRCSQMACRCSRFAPSLSLSLPLRVCVCVCVCAREHHRLEFHMAPKHTTSPVSCRQLCPNCVVRAGARKGVRAEGREHDGGVLGGGQHAGGRCQQKDTTVQNSLSNLSANPAHSAYSCAIRKRTQNERAGCSVWVRHVRELTNGAGRANAHNACVPASANKPEGEGGSRGK